MTARTRVYVSQVHCPELDGWPILGGYATVLDADCAVTDIRVRFDAGGEVATVGRAYVRESTDLFSDLHDFRSDGVDPGPLPRDRQREAELARAVAESVERTGGGA